MLQFCYISSIVKVVGFLCCFLMQNNSVLVQKQWANKNRKPLYDVLYLKIINLIDLGFNLFQQITRKYAVIRNQPKPAIIFKLLLSRF